MSFVVSAFGLTGMAATLAAGAAYGGMTTVGMNLIQGKGAFDNIGQGILLGGATAGLMSGVGSAMGGQTAEAIAGPAMQSELNAASQQALQVGVKDAARVTAAAEANTLATNKLVEQAVANPDAIMSPEKYREFLNQTTYRPPSFAANSYTPEGIAYQQSQGVPSVDIAQQAGEAAANASKFPGYSAETKALMKPATLMKNPANWMVQNPMAGAGIASGLMALKPAAFTPPPSKPTTFYRTSYNQPRYNPATGMYEPASYDPGSYYTNPTQYAARGGEVGYAKGGIANFYPLTGDPVDLGPSPGGLGGRGDKPRNPELRNMYDAGSEGSYTNTQGSYDDTTDIGIHEKPKPYTKTLAQQVLAAKNAIDKERKLKYDGNTDYVAQGGLMGTYTAGGKLLRGPGDGMSDSIPAVIQGQRPQRAALADGEFVIPADVVSHLGNGSTEAGSKRLYSMMDKIRQARTGNKKQGRQINPNKFMLA